MLSRKWYQLLCVISLNVLNGFRHILVNYERIIDSVNYVLLLLPTVSGQAKDIIILSNKDSRSYNYSIWCRFPPRSNEGKFILLFFYKWNNDITYSLFVIFIAWTVFPLSTGMSLVDLHSTWVSHFVWSASCCCM